MIPVLLAFCFRVHISALFFTSFSFFRFSLSLFCVCELKGGLGGGGVQSVNVYVFLLLTEYAHIDRFYLIHIMGGYL